MSTTTIWNVLNNEVLDLDIKRGVNIPMIQRDYAQGRKNNKTTEIRKVFLNNILNAINETIKEGKAPLELDFIYGYTESESFIPLDGQQRLTTLYLLHWYFAFKEHRLEEFKIPFSKFNYQTRQSSEDFLKNLASKLNIEDHERIFFKNEPFETVIKDKNWYFISWKLDLTIQSIITMLDEIHLVFKNSDILFSGLINKEKPCIVFNFLNIEKFGLSDDLYIKMNARGKPLNDFENLKAELGKFIEAANFNNKYNYTLKHSNGYLKTDVKTYFITKIDTDWTDYFWNIRNKETNNFDDKLLNLLAFVSLYPLIKLNLEKFNTTISSLDNKSTQLSYYSFLKLELLNENSIIDYIETLDLLVNNNEIIKEYLSDCTLLDKEGLINQSFKNNFKANYEQRVTFYAIFKFLLKTKESPNSSELKKWDRLLRNLIQNTNYNNSKDFQNSILDIDKVINKYNGNIYETFLETEIKGFDNQQITEEKLKITLINKSENWLNFILLAEKNNYLNGQIISILSFSDVYDSYIKNNINWTIEEDNSFLMKAKLYHQKISKIFNNNGIINFENYLFRRALLTKGDYLLYSKNWSFLIDSHRDISWKRLLKNSGDIKTKNNKSLYLKLLLDDIDINKLEDSLQQVINQDNCNDWRKDFIDNPILLKKSWNKHFKFIYSNNSHNIYALRKSKYNKSLDPEIQSILIQQKLIENGFNESDIELGYIESLNQYGIIRVKNLKPKIAYNCNFQLNYIIRQKGKEDFITKNQAEIINYIIENFKA